MFWGYLLLTLCLLPSNSNGAIVLRTTITNRAWVDYKSFFNKDYDEATETLRKEPFMESLKFVIVRNLAHELTDESYQAGLNAVSDFTPDEMDCSLDEDIGYDTTLREGIDGDESEIDGTRCTCGLFSSCPDELDWVKKDRVLPVGTQGCSDCYAWAATYALSSAVAIKTKSAPIDLSVQESKDCSYWANNGCLGGSADRVYEGLICTTKGKIVKTTEYNIYNTNQGKLVCNTVAVNKTKAAGTVKKVGRFASYKTEKNDDCKLRQELSKGPVVARMCVSPEVAALIHSKASDIYSNVKCTNECQADMLAHNKTVQQANHQVMIVGYTKTAWLVQNSWGSGWGYNGSVYFARTEPGSERICNLAIQTYWPIL